MQSWSRNEPPTVQSCVQILDCSWKTGCQSVLSPMHKMRKIWRKAAAPQMGMLPDFRTSGSLQTFSRTGVDYAGPFLVKLGRGGVQLKRYIAVFTCLQSRACHLEMVSSLDAVGFKMALTRLCGRRGTPTILLSDNGTNFVAIKKELRELIEALQSNAEVAADLTERGIDWKFNPPCAPHFGRVFERVVQSMKRAMQIVLSKVDVR